MAKPLSVLLTTEGTYPFHQGGVSTWCDILVRDLKSIRYTVYSILMDPFVTQKFPLPEGTELIKVPLWGTEEPSEHLSEAFSKTFLAKQRTNRKSIETRFIPLLEQLIREIVTGGQHPELLADMMLKMHLYFEEYEYKASFKSELAWETHKRIVLEEVAKPDSGWPTPNVYDMIQSMGWIYRFMNILNTPFPKTDVTHASAAAFCGIPCVLSKLKYGTPYMLTEHGIYLREQYLGLGKNRYSPFLNRLLIRLVHAVTALNYHYADQVSPVCAYNTRWETRFNVDPGKIKVIYNGVDKEVFAESAPKRSGPPTVVTVARIDPLKDIKTLIKSAAIVKSRIPDVKFHIYGSVSVQGYYEECLKLRDELELSDTVMFMGHTNNIATAYESGDIVALTSISEAFPYSVVEAMMCGRAIISTDVGGISEALGDTGKLVTPTDYEALADGIVHLLGHPEEARSMAEEARERALSYFTLDKVLESHSISYRRLAAGAAVESTVPARRMSAVFRREQQTALARKAYAFLYNGRYLDAVRHFKLAVMADPDSGAVPLLLLEIAESYNRMGRFDEAFLSMEKHEVLAEWRKIASIA